MTRDRRRPAATRSHREDWQHVHRAGQDPPYPPGQPGPGPGPTGPGPSGPGPSGPGRGYSPNCILLDEAIGLEDPILLPPRPPAARRPGDTKPEPNRPADTRPPRGPVQPAPEPRNPDPDRGDWTPPQPPPPPPPNPPPRPRVAGPQPLPPPPLPQPPDPPFPQPTATDGDGSIGGGGHCRRMALLLLPLLPLLFVVGLLMSRKWEPPPDGHLTDRHLKAPPEGEWHPRRDGGLPADQQGGNPDHTLHSNLEDS